MYCMKLLKKSISPPHLSLGVNLQLSMLVKDVRKLLDPLKLKSETEKNGIFTLKLRWVEALAHISDTFIVKKLCSNDK